APTPPPPSGRPPASPRSPGAVPVMGKTEPLPVTEEPRRGGKPGVGGTSEPLHLKLSGRDILPSLATTERPEGPQSRGPWVFAAVVIVVSLGALVIWLKLRGPAQPTAESAVDGTRSSAVMANSTSDQNAPQAQPPTQPAAAPSAAAPSAAPVAPAQQPAAEP